MFVFCCRKLSQFCTEIIHMHYSPDFALLVNARNVTACISLSSLQDNTKIYRKCIITFESTQFRKILREVQVTKDAKELLAPFRTIPLTQRTGNCSWTRFHSSYMFGVVWLQCVGSQCFISTIQNEFPWNRGYYSHWRCSKHSAAIYWIMCHQVWCSSRRINEYKISIEYYWLPKLWITISISVCW